ncbi:MAG: hypothetical protein ACRENQ_10710 [Gemmatimonadaceae bacterium]
MPDMTPSERTLHTGRRPWLAICLVACLGAPTVARGQQPVPLRAPIAHLDSLRKQYRVAPAPVQPIVVASFLSAPGSSLGSPSPSGVGSGDYFMGAGYQERTRFTSRADGGVGVGTGFGDPAAGVALEMTVSSYSSIRHSFASIGGLSFKLHHRDSQRMLLYAFGVENAVPWGLTDGGTSAYATAGRVFVLRPDENAAFGVLTTSLGIGTGRFRTQDAILTHRHTIGIFGGAGLRIIPAVAIAADWTGQDLDAGFTVTPFRNRGIVASIGYADLTRTAGNGPRFIMSIGYGFNAHRDNRRLSPEDLNAVFKTP